MLISETGWLEIFLKSAYRGGSTTSTYITLTLQYTMKLQSLKYPFISITESSQKTVVLCIYRHREVVNVKQQQFSVLTGYGNGDIRIFHFSRRLLKLAINENVKNPATKTWSQNNKLFIFFFIHFSIAGSKHTCFRIETENHFLSYVYREPIISVAPRSLLHDVDDSQYNSLYSMTIRPKNHQKMILKELQFSSCASVSSVQSDRYKIK